MTERLRLGIVGCGDIANYTAYLSRLNRRIHLAACCDYNPPTAERFAARHKISHVFESYHDLLAHKALDAIYLAVPHDLHFEMARDALQTGLHVLLEKPITRTLEEGESLARLADRSGLCLGVNYQYRYDVGCYALAMAAQSGDLGRLYYGKSNVPWQREKPYFEVGPWRGQKARAGGGTLITQGSHMLDLLLWSMGSQPKAAMGTTAQLKFHEVDVEDLAMAMVELENGALLEITSSMVAKPEQALRIEIYGAQGTARYSNKPFPHVKFMGPQIKRKRPPVKGLHAFQRSLEGFRRWVMEGEPYLIPAWEAIPVLATVSAIYQSATSGKREQVLLPHPGQQD
jgi:UDP-N-acetyl-2-amino-2-deoxyglucuronate dehydrogenase